MKLLHKLALLACTALVATSCASTGGKSSAAKSPYTAGGVRKDLNSVELVKLMGNGINLSNTMEAYGHISLGVTAEPTKYETLWGQPVTTQQLMNAFKAAGFDSIRIPVAWTNMMNFESGNYKINKAYLDRVQQIVDYALNAGLYVVINDHWDGSWWGMFGSATPATRENAMNLYVSMWTQISNRFKNYSDYLIFEGANEEVGSRLNDKDVAKDSGTLDEDACYKTANLINQTFVDTVRKTGGNNTYRFLLIPGYDTNISKTLDERLVMPTDAANKVNKLIISVHYYEPWSFCGGPSSDHWGTSSEYGIQNTYLGSMNDFVEKGYGVIIGEYGVSSKKDGTKKKDMCAWLSNVLDNCDYYNYCPMLWDTNTFFKREQFGIPDAEVAAVYKDRNYEAQSKFTDEQIKTAADNRIADRQDNAPDMLSDNKFVGRTDISVAWIMYNSKDWNVTYSVGDTYNPDSFTDGIKTTDAEITGPGTYTVGLDFSGIDGGYAVSTAFSAIGISNGEQLFPGYIVTIKEVKVNGKPYILTALPYTTSDDKRCTRVNIYNGWVKDLPKEARVNKNEDISTAKAVIVDNEAPELQEIKTLTITFDYGPAK